jgi:transposase
MASQDRVWIFRPGRDGVRHSQRRGLHSQNCELRPNGDQQSQMRRTAGCCRFVFNQALAIQIQRREQGQTELVFAQLNLRLAEWRRRPESTWLAEVPFGCLQHALRNLERAFARYNGRQAQFPRFKRRGLKPRGSVRRGLAGVSHVEVRWRGGEAKTE